MDDSKKTKEELQKELEALRQQVVDLEVLQKKRNQNNETRRHSENHFHEALKNSPIVVFNQDRELRYTWIYNPNPGFSAQEVLGKTDSELISPEDSKQLVEIKQQVLESGVGTKKEVSTTIDGKPYYYDLNVEPLRNSSGDIIGITCSALDVTNHVLTKISLGESEERYKRLSEVTTEGICFHDQGIVIDVNTAFTRIFGYKAEELIGKDVVEITCLPEYREPGRKKIAAFDEEPYEIEAQRKDGTVFPLEIEGRKVRYKGNVLRLACVRDITERKRIEEERKKLEEQLLQAQKMEAIGRLAGGVAHDFNNLLTGIVGYAELTALRMPKDDPLYNNLKEIQKSAERAAELTRHLLAFSRKQVIEPHVIELNLLIHGMDKMLKRIIGEDIDLMTVTGDGLRKVLADPSQVEQIILNLAVNARDAMPDGGTMVLETRNVVLDEDYIREHPGLDPGEYVMLSVADTGVGMSDDVKRNIFDPFFTTKEIGKGTGLGLSTIYGIVKQHNGCIWVDSAPGEGTTFRVYLPVVHGEIQPLKEVESVKMPRGSETVLLAEDEEVVRRLISNILIDLGYHVMEAESGKEALEVFKKHDGETDLLITDVIMPEMGGKELAEALQEKNRDIKVLYISGYTNSNLDQEEELEENPHFLPKPFTPGTLARKVRDILDT